MYSLQDLLSFVQICDLAIEYNKSILSITIEREKILKRWIHTPESDEARKNIEYYRKLKEHIINDLLIKDPNFMALSDMILPPEEKYNPNL